VQLFGYIQAVQKNTGIALGDVSVLVADNSLELSESNSLLICQCAGVLRIENLPFLKRFNPDVVPIQRLLSRSSGSRSSLLSRFRMGMGRELWLAASSA